MALYQSHFHNAHDFEIHGGQFINVAPGATLTINNDATDAVSTILRQYVATGATFDSAERYPPGKCHPGTRERIIQKIIDWIDDPHTVQYIVWLYGPAGSGKSALAQSICELLVQARPERMGASFFFSRGLTDRGNAFKIFTTISYQLAVRFPSVRAEINKALEQDPTLPTKSMEIQLQSLIIQPLLQCENLPSDHPVVIIDGLDECADDEEANTQREIVALIAKSIVDYTLPLRFFVASRPEYWIRDAFDTSPLPTITLYLSLRDDVDANRDIRTYLTDEFEKIRLKNKRLMGSVALPWPSKQVVDHLVYQASGQFVYASTVIRFVGKSSKFSNPQEQLLVIISPSPHRALAFSELDRLYVTVLSTYPRWETMKRVLGGLITYANPTIVRVLLDVDSDELVLVMDALSSLINISDARSSDVSLNRILSFSSEVTYHDTVMVSFSHLSFLEFLQDKTRAGAFYIDVEGFRHEITRACFGMIHRSLDQNYETDRYLTWNVNFPTYRWIMYKAAFFLCDAIRTDTLRPLVTHMIESLTTLVQFDSGRSMKSLVCFAEDMTVLKSAIEAKQPFTLGRRQLSRNEYSNQSPHLQSGTLWERFQDAIYSAQKRSTHTLSVCSELKVTPVLVYLAEFHRDETDWISFKQMFVMTNTLDVMSTVQQNRHLVHLSYYHNGRPHNQDGSDWYVKLEGLETWFKEGSAIRSNIQDSDEWKDLRILLASHMLNSVFSEIHFPMSYSLSCCSILGERFFDSRSMMDICGRKNPGNTCNCLYLLRIIGSLQSDKILRFRGGQETPHFQDVARLITSIICWLNRQLTNPQTLKILQDHEEYLTQGLADTMKHLFGKFFLQDFLQSYNSQFYARECSPHLQRSRYLSIIAIKVLPLPRGFYTEDCQDDPNWLDEEWNRYVLHWHAFHDEVFGKMEEHSANSTSFIIDPSCWHPHLASRLLNSLAKFLYGEIYPMFSISNHWNSNNQYYFQYSLSYLTQCLPFAWPTLENLDALRLLVYLLPQVTDVGIKSYLLPEGIWPLIATFLQKYPRSILSSEELNLFESWLYSPDHADISRYVSQ